MKKILAITAVLALGACNSDDHGARDDKNKVENYPTYDTTEKQGNINSGGQNNQLSSPDNADRNVTTN